VIYLGLFLFGLIFGHDEVVGRRNTAAPAV
jgi:hypothetical protein